MTATAWTTACSQCLSGPVGRAVRFVAVYIAGAELGHRLSFPGNFATFWPPSGIFVAALLITQTRHWPHVLLLGLLANLISEMGLHGHGLLLSLGFGFANCVEAVTCAWLLRRFVAVSPTFDSLKEVLGLSLLAGVLGTLAGATLGAAVVSLAFAGASFETSLRLWWIADVSGIILFTPALVTLSAARSAWSLPRTGWRIVEGVTALSSTVVFTFSVYSPDPQPYAFLVFPTLVWIALRFETRGICVANIIQSLISVWSTQQGHGPFAGTDPVEQRMLLLQAFLSASSISLLLLAAVVSERRRAARTLADSDSCYRDLLETTHDLVHSVDVGGKLLYTNRAWCETLGYTKAETASKSIFQVIHPDDLSLYKFKLARLLREEVRECIELRFLTKSGQTLVVEGSSKCRIVAGQPAAICSIFRDISSRHEHESQLDLYRRQLEEANFQLQLLATTDGLTGLQNRRAFQNRLEEEVERSQRYGHHVSLLLLDVDHFKLFNDSFGHPAGDEILKRVSRILEVTARLSDYVARYGGEEFAIILPNTDAVGAMTFAERLRLAIANEPWVERPLTGSLGVATLEPGCPLQDEGLEGSPLVHAADEALYYSKRQGRNRACHALDLTQVPV